MEIANVWNQKWNEGNAHRLIHSQICHATRLKGEETLGQRPRNVDCERVEHLQKWNEGNAHRLKHLQICHATRPRGDPRAGPGMETANVWNICKSGMRAMHTA